VQTPDHGLSGDEQEDEEHHRYHNEFKNLEEIPVHMEPPSHHKEFYIRPDENEA